MELLYKDLTYKVRGAIFNVYNALGSGHKESVYHKALAKEFDLQRINYTSEQSLDVIYKGEKVGLYKPDFIVEDKVLIELKALPILPVYSLRQLNYYLRGTSYKLGFLVNFGPELTIKRRIYESARIR